MYSSINGAYTIPSNINREFFLVAQGGGQTITMPALTIHQIINIKVLSGVSMSITAAVAGTIFILKQEVVQRLLIQCRAIQHNYFIVMVQVCIDIN